MKRAEFVERRAKYWRGELPYLSNGAPERAELDAEVAGIAWEPEAAALPERLGMRGISLIAEDHHFGHPFVADARMNYGGNDFDGYGAAVAVLTEAVRRYNAWPAIRAWAEGHERSCCAGGLLAILDGPAE